MHALTLKNLKGKSLKDALKGRSVGVLGLGQSGISATRCLIQMGCNVFLSESEPRLKRLREIPNAFRSLKSEYGGHTKKILNTTLLIVSPGIPWNLPVLNEARERAITVWSELELGWRLMDPGKVIAVTGTNGKTTTTSFLGECLKKSGVKTLVAGNIGKPLCDFAGSRFDCTVLEVSSYQLEGIDSFRPHVSVFLNLTSDHLHRHQTMARYAQAKSRIFLNQTNEDFCVLNREDPWCRKLGKKCPAQIRWFSTRKKLKFGVFYDQRNREVLARVPAQKSLMHFPPPAHLLGLHNIENVCAAIAAALSLRMAPQAIRESLLHFKGVEHRLEKVRVLKGVSYINDSKATNVDSTAKALESFETPVWIILGGEDKGAPYHPLRPLIRKRVKGIFLIGEASIKINSELKGSCEIFFCRTLSKAVLEASKKSLPGDTVLLSPACASFDQFKNFEERGKHFKDLVKNLPG